MNKNYNLCGIEAEPSHYKVMLEHLIDNLGSTRNVSILNFAVSDTEDEEVLFVVGHPKLWHGQSIVNNPNLEIKDFPDSKVIPIKVVTMSEL
ncbi:hypothetical protein DSN97_04250 [Deferribacteraceae bacterium V6Fe1]|nr:hypothetical protein DSN97_04250 [Deferribacteraceae bacterium V6Fe1]